MYTPERAKLPLMLGAWCHNVPKPALIKASRMREWRNPITIRADPGAMSPFLGVAL
jgi:hypothetical protein